MIFLFLAVDKFSQIHENLVQIMWALTKIRGLLFFAWIIPYGILLILLIPFMYKFIMKLPLKTRHLMILAGFTYILGALIIEMPEGWIEEKYGYHTSPFSIFYTIE